MALSYTILPIAHAQKAPAASCAAHRRLLAVSIASLVSILVLAAYCFQSTSHSVVPAPTWHPKAYLARSHRMRPLMAASPSFQFTPEQELAAVTSFVTALAANALPLDVDASMPVDPQLVLEFDVASPDAQVELAEMQQDVWTRHPVVLYAKKHSAASRAVKATLTSLHLTPAPTFVDIDVREDASVMTSVVSRITGSSNLPILLIAGRTIPIESLEALQASGELDNLLVSAGATVNGSLKVAVRERKQIQVTRTESGVVLEGQKRELTHEELAFQGLISV
ncbi:hypothetical protein HGRIS_000855 [Hohenbuehelia grisea]|uniref:Uncharacterized protein n=1 Tax=Hohenbuehelia grisea TaxID=104357 RepID=A0ABR3IQ31_9AGAR